MNIDRDKLELYLNKHKSSFLTVPGSFDLLLSAVMFLLPLLDWHPTGLLGLSPNAVRWLGYFFAAALFAAGIYKAVHGLTHRLTVEDMLKNIEAMNLTAHQFSLAVIKDPHGRYLQRYDARWNRYMFPYYRTPDQARDKAFADKLSSDLGCSLSSQNMGERVLHRYSESDHIDKCYLHTYYNVSIQLPKAFKRDEFTIGDTQYKWLSMARMKQIGDNEEVLKDIEELGL